MRFQTFSYRFTEQVLNSKLETKREIENIISSIEHRGYSRPELNEIFRAKFLEKLDRATTGVRRDYRHSCQDRLLERDQG